MKAVTLVLGASADPSRFSYQAIVRLRRYGHPVVAIGLRSGVVADVEIRQQWPDLGVHTVTVYIAPRHQPSVYAQIIALRPYRVIFNPGTENPAFAGLLRNAGIMVDEACTLVMLGAGTF
jgi:uncharacterized protein